MRLAWSGLFWSQPGTDQFDETGVRMTFAPRLVATAIKLHVFEAGDELSQERVRLSARMRVNVTMNHQDACRYSAEDTGLGPLLLETQYIVPGFVVSCLVGWQFIA